MKFAATLVLIVLAGSAAAQSHYRQGYMRKDGTYIPPSYATNPNDTKLDNYSTKGNINPYTGKAGTIDPYKYEAPKVYNPYTQPEWDYKPNR